VGTKLSQPLTVKVTDADGATVGGATVGWATASGSLTSSTSVTDARGIATMEWTLGPQAGNQTATATVLSRFVTFRQAAVPGALSQIILSRDTVRLLGLGDAFRLSARAADRFGNAVLVSTTVVSADTAIVTADNFGNGAVLTAHTSDRTTTVQAVADTITKSGTVIILPAPCQAGVQGTTLGPGESALLTGLDASEFCLTGTGSGAEFIAIPFYSDFNGTLVSHFTAAGQLMYDSVHHILYGNTDADTSAEFAIALNGVTSLSGVDFVL
jgi:hypothetical protein